MPTNGNACPRKCGIEPGDRVHPRGMQHPFREREPILGDWLLTSGLAMIHSWRRRQDTHGLGGRIRGGKRWNLSPVDGAQTSTGVLSTARC